MNMETNSSEFNIKDKSVCFVGLICLDIVAAVKKFPTEDIGQQCEDCIWQRGGNAGNSAVVFSILGGNSSFFGTLSDTHHTPFLTNDLEKNNVSITQCKTIKNSSCPISIVILNGSNGSRTVLHTNKNLKELTLKDFSENCEITKHDIGWVHFEGRDNCPEMSKMMKYLVDCNKHVTPANRIIFSFEVEKLRLAQHMESLDLWKMPDVLFVSKDFAKSQGIEDMKTSAEVFFEKAKDGAIVICAWGEQGAAAKSAKDGLVYCPAFPPAKVIDTCGAGDTFNAAVIWALVSGKNLETAITLGCRVAGEKCGIQGFNDLRKKNF